MKPPALTTLKVEDFPEEGEWIGKLLSPINQVFTGIISALNANTTFGDNIPCQTKELAFKWSGASQLPVKFAYTLTAKPVELRICQAKENSKPVALVCAWDFANNVVSLSGIWKVTDDGVSQLVTGAQYNITVRVHP